MNALNRALTAFFDAVLTPLEYLGHATALIVISAIFGVLALLVFKHISWQKGIKASKDRIKAHMIEIRLYQDDLVVVASAVSKVVLRNLQYLGLNFGPIVPLAIPFMFVSAQFVVRYAYDPLPIAAPNALVRAGAGTLLTIELTREHAGDLKDLRVVLPPGLKAVSPLVRVPGERKAFQEFVAIAPGTHEITLEIAAVRETKLVVAGSESTRTMQPRRVSSSDWLAVTDADRWPVLWPAEPAFSSDSPFRVVSIAYPAHELPWLPDGEFGILLAIVLASMLFGAVALKPLGVQI